MDIRRLEAFCKVYELGSFSKAGQELYLSQPTISAHVSSLEQELGVQLFDRLGRTVLPTQAGEVLYRYAMDIFVSIENAKAEIQLLQDHVTGDLIIGASTIPANYMLPGLLGSFSAKYPEVRMQVKVGDSASVLERIIKGELSVGLIGSKVEMPDIVSTPLKEDELVIVAHPRFKEQLEGQMTTREMCLWPWIMRERGSGTRQAFDKALIGIGLDIDCMNVAVSVESTEAVVQCVLSGIGVSVTSRMAADRYIQAGQMVELSFPGLSLQRTFYLIRHEKRHLFPVVRYFVKFLEENKSVL